MKCLKHMEMEKKQKANLANEKNIEKKTFKQKIICGSFVRIKLHRFFKNLEFSRQKRFFLWQNRVVTINPTIHRFVMRCVKN